MGKAYRSAGYKIHDFDIVDSKGCYIYDETGKQYLDFESGVWCCTLGYGNNPWDLQL